MTERDEFPCSYEDVNRIVHTGERCIRVNGESDWPWFNCGDGSAGGRWVPKAPNCLWCVAQRHRCGMPVSTHIDRRTASLFNPRHS